MINFDEAELSLIEAETTLASKNLKSTSELLFNSPSGSRPVGAGVRDLSSEVNS